MPSNIVILTGQTVGGLKELKSCAIPSNAREYTLLSGLTDVSNVTFMHSLLTVLF